MEISEYSRKELIDICEKAVVQQDKWLNRDSPSAHQQLGLCWVMLKAGCDFWIHQKNNSSQDTKLITDENTIWLTINWKTFMAFEYGGGHEESKTFYLPSRKRLERVKDKDWY